MKKSTQQESPIEAPELAFLIKAHLPQDGTPLLTENARPGVTSWEVNDRFLKNIKA